MCASEPSGGAGITSAKNSTNVAGQDGAPANNSGTPIAVVDGTVTLNLNSVFISFKEAYAMDQCSNKIGSSYPGAIVTLASTDLSSLRFIDTDTDGAFAIGSGLTSPIGWTYLPYSFNYADLNQPVPWSAWNGLSQCNEFGACATITDDAYRPILEVPSQIRALDPLWASCALDFNGLYDPPVRLTAESTIASPTVGWQSPTPAPSPLPQNTPAPSTNAPGQTSPSASPSIQDPSSPSADIHASDSFRSTASESKASLLVPESSVNAPAVTQTSDPASFGQSHDPVSVVTSTNEPIVSPQSQASPADPPAATQVSNTLPAPQDPSSPVTSTSRGLGDIIASIMGMSAVVSASTAQTAADPISSSLSDAGQQRLSDGGPALTVGGDLVSAVSNGVVDGSSTLLVPAEAPEGSITVAIVTVNGRPIFLDPSSSDRYLVGPSSASPTDALMSALGEIASLDVSSGMALDPTGIAPAPGADITLGSSVVTLNIANPSAPLVIGSVTLTPGGPEETISGTPVSLAGSYVVVGSSTIPLATPSGAEPEMLPETLTLNSAVVTVLPVAGQSGVFAIGSVTLSAGGPAVTISGTPISLGGADFVIGTSTIPMSASQPPDTSSPVKAIVTAGGETLTATELPGQSGVFVVDAATLSVSGPAATIDGALVSVATGGIVVNGVTDPVATLLGTESPSGPLTSGNGIPGSGTRSDAQQPSSVSSPSATSTSAQNSAPRNNIAWEVLGVSLTGFIYSVDW